MAEKTDWRWKRLRAASPLAVLILRWFSAPHRVLMHIAALAISPAVRRLGSCGRAFGAASWQNKAAEHRFDSSAGVVYFLFSVPFSNTR